MLSRIILLLSRVYYIKFFSIQESYPSNGDYCKKRVKSKQENIDYLILKRSDIKSFKIKGQNFN